jgi:hypothetical protein
MPIQYPKTVGHVFIGYQIKTSPNTVYCDWIALQNPSSLINWDQIRSQYPLLIGACFDLKEMMIKLLRTKKQIEVK